MKPSANYTLFYNRLRIQYPFKVLFNRGAFVGMMTGMLVGIGFVITSSNALEFTATAMLMICTVAGHVFGGMMCDILEECSYRHVKRSFRMNEKFGDNIIELDEELREYYSLRAQNTGISGFCPKFSAMKSVRAFAGSGGRAVLVEERALHRTHTYRDAV